MVTPPAEESTETSFGGLIGQSTVMRDLYSLLARLARNDLSVVMQGATGTGKEEAARALQTRSRRSSGPFVVLDCTAIPPTLAPSILFGHEKGAFTGATERRSGVFESANDGVLFIDEVGELPLDLQPLLLRVLENREVVPVGATRPRRVNVRVISATWRDLRAMVNKGTFREDLYYRLAQAALWMPSLDERRDDIPLLVQHFLARLPREVPAARSASPEALAMLAARSFPGNVRELRNTVERMALLADGPVVTAADLRFERMLATVRTNTPPAAVSPYALAASDEMILNEPFKEAKRTIVDEFEHGYLVQLLERAQRNLTRAALLAGLERHNLRDLLKKHGLYAAKE
jgi:DNA-binding NtrC family response regulator